MGIFDALSKKNRTLSKARQDAERNRSPATVSQLVLRLVEFGELEEAQSVAERGAQDFPESDRVQEAQRAVVRAMHAPEIEELKGVLRSGPSPNAYYRLACLYREMGDLEQTVELARKCKELYKEYEGPYIVLGDIRHERFVRDGLASDGMKAVELYEKAYDLNHSNYRLLLHLCELYLKVGAAGLALSRAEGILAFAPEDERAFALRDRARKAKSPDNTSLSEQLDAYEVRFRTRGGEDGRPERSLGRRFLQNPDHLSRKLRSLMRVEGVRRVFAYDPSGKPIAGQPAAPSAEPEATKSAGAILEASIDCSLRMDISTFRQGVVEGPQGTLYMALCDGLRLAIFCGPETKAERLETEISQLLESDIWL